MRLKVKDLENILGECNKKWKLDFVHAHSGYCCLSCMVFNSKRIEDLVRFAETFVLANHFLGGMNYKGKMQEKDTIHMIWKLPELLAVEEVCEDLEQKINDRGFCYKVICPEDKSKTIRLQIDEVTP